MIFGSLRKTTRVQPRGGRTCTTVGTRSVLRVGDTLRANLVSQTSFELTSLRVLPFSD